MNAHAGGFLAAPPGLDGSTGLGIAGITGAPRPSEWDAVVSAEAPDVPGEEVHFVTLEDGSIIVEEDVPDGCLAQLADAVEQELDAPYRVEAARNVGDVWAAGAQRVTIATLPAETTGEEIELTSYEGERRCAVDGEPCEPVTELEAIGDRRGTDFALRAQRLDDTTWVVDVEPL